MQAAKTHSSIALVLDHSVDAAGNAPGCYVLTNDGTKEALMAGVQSTTELNLSGKRFTVEERQISSLITDSDQEKRLNAKGKMLTILSPAVNWPPP